MFSNVLDSRSIGLGDAFGQRFMRPGTYRYNIVRAGLGDMADSFPYVIEVGDADPGATMEQHNIVVVMEGSSWRVDREKISIREGDLVLWACPDQTSQGFEVRGDKQFFGSGRMTNECGYSHAFGLPGEYHWVDAHGGNVSGVVRVGEVQPKNGDELARWRKRVAQGTLVLIAEGKAEPAEVNIVVGQTVFFAIVKGEGISITDSTLLAGRKPATGATKKPIKKSGARR
jgi:plastocyanin